MFAEPGFYVLALLAVANLVLIGCLLRALAAQQGAAASLAVGLDARLGGLDRNDEALRRSVTEMDQALRREIATGTRDGLTGAFDKVQEGTKAQAEGLVAVQQALNQLAETVRGGFDGFSQTLRQDQEQLRHKVKSNLEEIRTGNEAKLEQMRLTVDEKLQTTLEQRLGASFKQVSNSLEQVYKSVGEMQALAVGVGDLKRVLTNIKSRGTWTEIELENMLAQVLTTDQYGRNVEVKPGSNQRVEFAIRLPGDEETPVWLPIDVKFPTADYERLMLAAERGSPEEVEQATRRSRCASASRRARSAPIRPPAAQHRFRGDVPADRRTVRRGRPPARSGRHDAARMPRHGRRPDDAVHLADRDADGLPLAGDPEAFGRGMEGARRRQARVRYVRRLYGQGQQETWGGSESYRR